MSSEITEQTYAVPYFQQEPLAKDQARRRVMRAIGDYATHQRLGYPMTTFRITDYFQDRPEAWVRIGGVSAVHSAMLAHFAWIPEDTPKETA